MLNVSHRVKDLMRFEGEFVIGKLGKNSEIS